MVFASSYSNIYIQVCTYIYILCVYIYIYLLQENGHYLELQQNSDITLQIDWPLWSSVLSVHGATDSVFNYSAAVLPSLVDLWVGG